MTAPSLKTKTVVVSSEKRSREPLSEAGLAPLTATATSSGTGLGRGWAACSGVPEVDNGGSVLAAEDTESGPWLSKLWRRLERRRNSDCAEKHWIYCLL